MKLVIYTVNWEGSKGKAPIRPAHCNVPFIFGIYTSQSWHDAIELLMRYL